MKKDDGDPKYGYYGHGIDGYTHYMQDFREFHKNDRPTARPTTRVPWLVISLALIVLYIIIKAVCDGIYA